MQIPLPDGGYREYPITEETDPQDLANTLVDSGFADSCTVEQAQGLIRMALDTPCPCCEAEKLRGNCAERRGSRRPRRRRGHR